MPGRAGGETKKIAELDCSQRILPRCDEGLMVVRDRNDVAGDDDEQDGQEAREQIVGVNLQRPP